MDRDRLRPFLTGIAIVVAIGGLYLIDQGRMTCGRLRGPKIGQRVPDFSLPDLAGKRVKLSSLRGQVVVLDFWATWCRACIRKMPQLEQLQADFRDRGLTVLAINVEDRDVLSRFLQQRPLKLTILLDDRGIAEQYAAFALPHLALLDRQGKLVYAGAGGGLRQRVVTLLRQSPPRDKDKSRSR